MRGRHDKVLPSVDAVVGEKGAGRGRQSSWRMRTTTSGGRTATTRQTSVIRSSAAVRIGVPGLLGAELPPCSAFAPLAFVDHDASFAPGSLRVGETPSMIADAGDLGGGG